MIRGSRCQSINRTSGPSQMRYSRLLSCPFSLSLPTRSFFPFFIYYFSSVSLPPYFFVSVLIYNMQEGFRKTMLDYWNGCCIASAIVSFLSKLYSILFVFFKTYHPELVSSLGRSLSLSQILQALAMSLGLSQDYFTERHKKSDCSMELKRYPPPPHTPRQQFHTRCKRDTSRPPLLPLVFISFFFFFGLIVLAVPPHLQGLRIPKSQSKPDTENNDTDPSLRNHHHHRFNEHSDLSSITLLIQTSSIPVTPPLLYFFIYFCSSLLLSLTNRVSQASTAWK